MIIRSNLDNLYAKWNNKWGAPFGRDYSPKPSIFSSLSFTRPINKLSIAQKSILVTKLLGMFAFERNNTNRIYEYPWAFYAAKLSPSQQVLEIGGGFSGFQFVLAKHVRKVINIDPLDKNHSHLYYQQVFKKLNQAFNTDVTLKITKINKIKIKQDYFDRVFCLSVLEHLNRQDCLNIFKYARYCLKPKGLFIISIDLFLDLSPFSQKIRNIYGSNVDIHELVKTSGFKLIYGNTKELMGYPDFSPQAIMANLDKYLISSTYPLLSQTLILQKE